MSFGTSVPVFGSILVAYAAGGKGLPSPLHPPARDIRPLEPRFGAVACQAFACMPMGRFERQQVIWI
jgi:hypothetical protein